MGAVSSLCKRKNPVKIIRDNYTQTEIPTANTFHSKAQHLFIRRKSINSSSNSYRHYSLPPGERYSKSTKHIHSHSIVSTPSNIPLRDRNNISYHRPRPYVSQSFHSVSSSVRDPFYSQAAARTCDHLVPSSLNTTQDVYPDYRKLTRIGSSMTMDKPAKLRKQNDRSHLLKHPASTPPIDMFIIDLSNEHVLINQPVSMNIRHSRLNTLENHQTHSTISDTHEKLLNYIPYVCEKYPNPTVDFNQPTRNTLHVRVS
jgi:hypothetical protein